MYKQCLAFQDYHVTKYTLLLSKTVYVQGRKTFELHIIAAAYKVLSIESKLQYARYMITSCMHSMHKLPLLHV